MRGVQVRHAMTAEVVSTPGSATLLEAARLMRKHHVSGLPVVDGGRVVGVLSEKDIARALDAGTPSGLLDLVIGGEAIAAVRLETMREGLKTTAVKESMTPDPFTIGPDAPLETAAQILRERKINRLPVVENGRLVGILTRNDVLNAL